MGRQALLLQGKVGQNRPHQSPSVTASPKGKPLGCAALPRKSVPNQGTQMGPVIGIAPLRPTTPKTSEWERAGHKKGGGGIPRDLRPGFL